MLVTAAAPAPAQETITPLATISVSTTTGEKPQSKLWAHAGTWWAVLPSTSASPSGTWLWRLEPSARWTAVLRLSASTSTKADARALGDVTHVLLYGSSPQLVSIEYVAATDTYRPWMVRPTATAITLPDSETATIDADTTGRLWLSTESGTSIRVHYSDPPYTAFGGPITLASNINGDDISVVTSLFPDPAIGVLWSNQNSERFGFRVHVDGTSPTLWQADEVPAAQSALSVGGGLADDHLNVKVGSDGTLYAAVKTSYNSSGFPVIGLLVRRPSGHWDDLYTVDTGGTRGIVLLNELAGFLRVVFTTSTSGGNIVYRDSALSPIAFGGRRTLLTGSLNNATSAKPAWTDEVAVVASGRGVLIREGGIAPTTTTTTTRTTTSTTGTTIAGPTTTTTTTSTTTTTRPASLAVTVDSDVSVRIGDGTAFGTRPLLEVDNSPVKRAFLRIVVSGTGGRPVTVARLRLQVATVDSAGSDSKGRLHRAACEWSETTLTGTTQPQPVIDAAVLAAPAGAATQGQVVDFDLGSTITGDGVFCVALDSTSSNGVDYVSREGGAGGPAVLVTLGP